MKLYISSYEYKEFEIPREVLHYQKINLDKRNVLIVEVDQPLIGQKYGLLGDDITKFYLVNRVDENAFDKLNKFPIDVHILIVKNPKTINPTSIMELQNIAWACLYDNKKDAINHRVV
jgi:hypothetical protein